MILYHAIMDWRSWFWKAEPRSEVYQPDKLHSWVTFLQCCKSNRSPYYAVASEAENQQLRERSLQSPKWSLSAWWAQVWALVFQDPEGEGLSYLSHSGVGPWGSEPRSEVYQADRLHFGVPNPCAQRRFRWSEVYHPDELHFGVPNPKAQRHSPSELCSEAYQRAEVLGWQWVSLIFVFLIDVFLEPVCLYTHLHIRIHINIFTDVCWGGY